MPITNIIHSFYSLANIFATMSGCGSADTDRVMRMHEAGMDEEILVCLRKCRCSMIEDLHEKQRKIDCMDRLIRRAGNQADPANSYR